MENVSVLVRKNLTMEKYFSQVKIVTPNNISRLLKTSARAVVLSAEVVNNFLMVSGKIVANAVYLNDENKVENTETTVDFVEKQKISFMLSELSAEDVLEIQNINVSSSEVVLSLAHKTKILGMYRYLLGDATKITDEYVLHHQDVEMLGFKQVNDESFVVAEEVDSNLRDLHILNVSSEPILTSYVCGVDKVVIDGKVRVNALYADSTGLGEIAKEFEFKQEVSVKGVLPGMSCDVSLKHLNTAIVEQSKEEKTSLAFVIDLSAKVYVFENLMVHTYDDIYSLSNEIAPVYEFAEFAENDGLDFDTDTVLTQTNISHIEDFDDIVGVYQPQVNILEMQDKEDRVVVLAEISALALYKTQTSIEKLDLVYETRFEVEKELDKKLSNVSASAFVSAFKVKAGKDLECAFSVEYKFEYEKFKTLKFVKAYNILEEKKSSEAGVKVYVTRENQSLFDVARVLNVRPELIASQMEVKDTFESGQKVFVYCPLNIV